MTGAGEDQMLVLFQPAGRMEQFFHEMSRIGNDVSASHAIPARLREECGMELLGPPLGL